MPVEQFTRQDFEDALPKDKSGCALWQFYGLAKGEYEYLVIIPGTNKRIVIRSSVRPDGQSAAAGEDSIRMWIEYKYRNLWYPLKRHKTVWTTRVAGWQGRMTDKLRELYQIALADSRRVSTQAPVEKQEPDFIGDKSTAEPVIEKDEVCNPTPPIRQESQKHGPNAEQLAAIEAPVDANCRVLAGPGSGKTFTIVRRYAHLVENGVKPETILAVTFSRAMADELGAKINAFLPELSDQARKQICTIHALCFRVLKSEGDKRHVTKTWQEKKACEEIAEELWPYSQERPAWKDLLAWINAPKSAGLTSADDLPFYQQALGGDLGRDLHEARKRFDQVMRGENLITFQDMLFEVDVKLQRDKSFCQKWQGRFSHVIVDEGQDTSRQAMRILVTLSK